MKHRNIKHRTSLRKPSKSNLPIHSSSGASGGRSSAAAVEVSGATRAGRRGELVRARGLEYRPFGENAAVGAARRARLTRMRAMMTQATLSGQQLLSVEADSPYGFAIFVSLCQSVTMPGKCAHVHTYLVGHQYATALKDALVVSSLRRSFNRLSLRLSSSPPFTFYPSTHPQHQNSRT